MITGMHAILYSSDPEADKAFFLNVLQLSHVDVGHGWLIFGLPPSEIAVHPSDTNDRTELYFLCEDIRTFIREMTAAKIQCGPIQDQRWGYLTQVTLPGGGKIGVYQPLHKRPDPMP
jgi:hypothetical protein